MNSVTNQSSAEALGTSPVVGHTRSIMSTINPVASHNSFIKSEINPMTNHTSSIQHAINPVTGHSRYIRDDRRAGDVNIPWLAESFKRNAFGQTQSDHSKTGVVWHHRICLNLGLKWSLAVQSDFYSFFFRVEDSYTNNFLSLFSCLRFLCNTKKLQFLVAHYFQSIATNIILLYYYYYSSLIIIQML